MSARVNKIIFSSKKFKTREELMDIVSKQIDLLLKSGYNTFVTDLHTKDKAICVEFCPSDPQAKNREIPQPCWLYMDELEYLANYQVQNMLEEAKNAVIDIQKELNEEAEDKKEKEDKDDKFDA